MEESINFLSFLIIVLIAVIVSKNARKVVRKIVNFLTTSIIFLIIASVIIGIIALLVSLVAWGWNKLHEIFPRLWSIGEIIGIVLLLVGMVLITIIVNYIDGKLKNKYGTERIQKIYNRIGKIFKSIGYDFCILGLLTLIVVSATLLFFYHNDEILTIGLLGLFSLYLVIKYVVLPIRKLFIKKNAKK